MDLFFRSEEMFGSPVNMQWWNADAPVIKMISGECWVFGSFVGVELRCATMLEW